MLSVRYDVVVGVAGLFAVAIDVPVVCEYHNMPDFVSREDRGCIVVVAASVESKLDRFEEGSKRRSGVDRRCSLSRSFSSSVR